MTNIQSYTEVEMKKWFLGVLLLASAGTLHAQRWSSNLPETPPVPEIDAR